MLYVVDTLVVARHLAILDRSS